MKLSIEKNTRILIICIAAIAILCVFLLSGTIVHSLNLSTNRSTNETNNQTIQLFFDSEFDISEANLSQVTGRTLIHVTPDEIRTITGLEEAMQETNNDPDAWVEGWRSVKSFEGNGTQYDTFVSKVCSGKKTLAECFSNNGTLFEYQGHYYDISRRYTRGPRAPARAPPRTPPPVNQSLLTASLSENTPFPTPTRSPVVYSTMQYDAQGCPVLLTNPVEHFACPRDLPAAPVTYRPADPHSPTQAEMDAIPVNFPGLDRDILVRAALKDPCVTEFLASGGGIEGITDQPRPTAGKESVRWPPTLMGYRMINCTEMLVFFDINPSAGNISRITVDFR